MMPFSEIYCSIGLLITIDRNGAVDLLGRSCPESIALLVYCSIAPPAREIAEANRRRSLVLASLGDILETGCHVRFPIALIDSDTSESR